MNQMKSLAALLAPLILGVGAMAPPAAAQDVTAVSAITQTLVVAKDKSVAFRLGYPVGEIVVAQPDVLQLVATTDQSFYVRGKTLGVTNLLIYDKSHRLMQVVDVRVGFDTDSLQADLKSALPKEQIVAANFAGGIRLSGKASTMYAAARASEIAEHYAPKGVSSDMVVQATDQVMVEVRIIEASRSGLKELGFNINATDTSGFSIGSGTGGLASNIPPQTTFGISRQIGSVTIDASIQALEQKGVVRTLAKPNLIAMSGEQASFLAGGEFPYPVPNGPQQVSIEFKPFGVKLNVTPDVQDNGSIRLKIAPEVSALDPTQRLRIDGFDLPALTVRKASTVVELKDGESFAIAGLFQRDYINSISQMPGAGDIPVLGALFRSSSWKRKETELIIIVTPRLTAPSAHVEDLRNPLKEDSEPDSIDLILMGRTFDKPLSRDDYGPKQQP